MASPSATGAFLPTFLRSIPAAERAFAFAAEHHHGQQRESDCAPFIIHPLEVASMLRNTGHDEHVIAAAILHDVVEDADVAVADIEAAFGARMASLVSSLSEDDAITDLAERKAALRDQVAAAGPEVLAIYAADKVAKVRELRAQMARQPVPPEHDEERRALRLDHYRASLRMLETRVPSHPMVHQLRFELEALEALPPQVAAR